MANRFTSLLALFMMRGTLPKGLRWPAFIVATVLLVGTLVVSLVALWEAPITADTIALTTLFILVAVFLLNAAKDPDPKKGDAVKRYVEQDKEKKDGSSSDNANKR